MDKALPIPKVQQIAGHSGMFTPMKSGKPHSYSGAEASGKAKGRTLRLSLRNFA